MSKTPPPRPSCEDGFIYHEMMVHPALFTHRHPKKVAIVGNDRGLVVEVLKHTTVQELTLISPTQENSGSDLISDNRIIHCPIEIGEWMNQTADESFDIIILAQPATDKGYQRLLQADGVWIQPHLTRGLDQENWQPLQQMIHQAGFNEWQLFHFPQPSHPAGWCFAIMASKAKHFKRIREKDIFNRNFITRYYNLDVHNASLALPEFIKSAIHETMQ